jgi:hypothetical protein
MRDVCNYRYDPGHMVDECKTENARCSDRFHWQRFRSDRSRMLQFCHSTMAAIRGLV